MGRTRMMFLAGMIVGAAMYALLSAWSSTPTAFAQTPSLGRGPAPAGAPAAAPGGQTAGIDERKVELVYANYFLFSTTNDEVVTDLGFVRPNRAIGNEPDNIFEIRTRLVTSFATTKKLYESFGKIIQAYENQYGPIRTEPPARVGAPVIPPTGR